MTAQVKKGVRFEGSDGTGHEVVKVYKKGSLRLVDVENLATGRTGAARYETVQACIEMYQRRSKPNPTIS